MTDSENDWEITPDSKIKPTAQNGQSSGADQPVQLSKTVRRIVDPNAINTSSVNGPIVIFYGPREVGKTVALLRLSKFVQNFGNVQIRVNPGFRTDEGYLETKTAFQDILRTDNMYSPTRTGKIDFVLLDFFTNGNLYCQFLEAPGEHFYDSNDDLEPRPDYVAYLQNIMDRDNKKVYVFFFEENMFGSPDKRRRYADKIAALVRSMQPYRDRILILYNKVDAQPEIQQHGEINSDTLKDLIFKNPEYNQFKVAIQTSRLKHIYFVPFSSGRFPLLEGSDVKRWILGRDNYPRNFYEAIRKSIDKKGFWAKLFGY